MLVCRLRRCSDGEEGTRGWHWNLLDCPHSCPWHSLAPLFAGIGKGQRVARRAEATRPQGCAVAREAARLRYREAAMRHACEVGPQGCDPASCEFTRLSGCECAGPCRLVGPTCYAIAASARGCRCAGLRGCKYVHACGWICPCIHTQNWGVLVTSSELRAFVVKNVPAALRRRR